MQYRFKYKVRETILFLCALSIICSCKKYLDAKADKSFVVASSLQDAQALMDSYFLTKAGALSTGNIMDDNFYISDAYWAKRNPFQQSQIIWDPKAIGEDPFWKTAYQYVSQSNVALETLSKIKTNPSQIDAFNLAKGSALFMRAYLHFQVALVHALQYEESKASSTLGIPYKLTSDINDETTRPTLKQTYDHMISDLKEAADLLPTKVNFPTRPSKQAALGALSRIYLSMNDYSNALRYADSSLHIYDNLMTFANMPKPSATSTVSPFPLYNQEDILHMTGQALAVFSTANWACDSVLYNSYDSNDLRKVFYFVKNSVGKNSYGFRGSYDNTTGGYPFGGIATDELHLVREECLARTGNVADALNDLNYLLSTRWKTGTYQNRSANGMDEALNIILTERRKELVLRNNLRWMDLKRLNLDPKYAITITKKQNGIIYTLPPNDLRYALLIPMSVIQNSGIEQNKR